MVADFLNWWPKGGEPHRNPLESTGKTGSLTNETMGAFITMWVSHGKPWILWHSLIFSCTFSLVFCLPTHLKKAKSIFAGQDWPWFCAWFCAWISKKVMVMVNPRWSTVATGTPQWKSHSWDESHLINGYFPASYVWLSAGTKEVRRIQCRVSFRIRIFRLEVSWNGGYPQIIQNYIHIIIRRFWYWNRNLWWFGDHP